MSYRFPPGLDVHVNNLLAQGKRLVPYEFSNSVTAAATTAAQDDAFLSIGSNPFLWTATFGWAATETFSFRLIQVGTGEAFASARGAHTGKFSDGFVPLDASYLLNDSAVLALDYKRETGSSDTLYVTLKGLLIKG